MLKLKRSTSAGFYSVQYALNGLIIDTQERLVRREGEVIRLPDLSFDTFMHLIEAAPAPQSGPELARCVWRADHVSDETIAQRIALIRKALGDDPRSPRYIRTIRGAGYAIVGEVVRLEPKPEQTDRPIARSVRAPAHLVATLACLLAVSLLWFSLGHTDNRTALASSSDHDGETSALVSRARQLLALHQSMETDRALGMLRAALSTDPVDYNARLSLSFALSTKATKFGGTFEHKKEAEALARELIEERPESSNAWSALGYSLGSQGRMNESLSALQYAYQLDPDNAPAGSSAAHVHLIQGQLYEALDLEFRVREAGGRSRYAEIQIAQSLELIEHPEAQSWHAKAMSLNPGQVVVLSEVARSHLRHGQPNRALDVLAQAEGKDETAPSILHLRGRANLALGQMEEARDNLKAAGRWGQFDLAALDALAGDHGPAKAFLSPAKLADLDADPDPQFRVQLAELAAAAGHERQAFSLIGQAVSLGWRDIRWLNHSPFLREFMDSGMGHELRSRMARELETQRLLMEGDASLSRAISEQAV
ncbi:MAG: winged helix-turn-helix domain-containing protein [Pseudomonadota bacterium]